MKHNFKVTDNEENEYWISRSPAAMAAIFAYDIHGFLCVLVNKRGDGTPDFQGCWNMPGGYIEYDETIQMGIAREVTEETGIILEPSDFNLFGVHSDPSGNDVQNITFKFWVDLPKTVEYYKPMLTSRNADEGEVSTITFMRVEDITKHKTVDDFAFNHYILICKLVDKFYNKWNSWFFRKLCILFNKYFMKFK